MARLLATAVLGTIIGLATVIQALVAWDGSELLLGLAVLAIGIVSSLLFEWKHRQGIRPKEW